MGATLGAAGGLDVRNGVADRLMFRWAGAVEHRGLVVEDRYGDVVLRGEETGEARERLLGGREGLTGQGAYSRRW